MSMPATLPAGAAPSPAWDWSPFRVVAPALAVGLLLLGLVFNQETVAAVRTWNESTAYNHCILIIPIFAWLVWDRRFSLIGVPIVPDLRFVLLSLPCIVAWLAAERLGVMEGRQLMLLCLVQILFLSVLGWRMYYALLGPMLYLFFLVPFGAFLTTTLQDFTTAFTLVGLDLLGIPYYSDGYVIEIAQGTFLVAEACAGLRFLIASIAFGVLYALVMYRSPWRRFIFIGVSIVTPVVANGFRALGIVVLGRFLGSAQAAGADHLVYGWIFFSFVILLLVVFGLPFREDTASARPSAPPAPPPPVGAARISILSVVLLVGLAASGPVAVAQINRSVEQAAVPSLAALTADTGCKLVTGRAAAAEGPDNAVPAPVVRDGGITQFFGCNGYTVAVRMEIFSPRTGAGRLLEAQRRMTEQLGTGETMTSWLSLPGEGPRVWRVTEMEDSANMAASSLWIGGKPTQIGLATRIRLAIQSLNGDGPSPLLVTVTPAGDWRNAVPQYRPQARQAIELFFRSQKSLSAQLAALSDKASGPKS
jgi:exosortase A